MAEEEQVAEGAVAEAEASAAAVEGSAEDPITLWSLKSENSNSQQ